MVPLALGIGEGSELMQPLAIAVVGGLSVSTLLTLFVVPVAYIVAHRAGDRLALWLTGREPERPPAGAPEPAVSQTTG
jgi:HAE1 family hydrophobic/amphiphilic exporter-1